VINPSKDTKNRFSSSGPSKNKEKIRLIMVLVLLRNLSFLNFLLKCGYSVDKWPDLAVFHCTFFQRGNYKGSKKICQHQYLLGISRFFTKFKLPFFD